MRFLLKILFSLAVFCALSSHFTILAQSQGDSVGYPVINEIRTEFEGFRAASDQYVFSSVQLRAGMDYNPMLADQSIRTLYSTGRFELVEIRVDNAVDDKVDVIIELTSKYTIQQIQFLGNDKYADSRLVSKAELETDTPLDEYSVSLGAEKITKYYVEKGFPDAVVDYRIERDEQTGYAVVSYDITEGDEVRISEITFVGNDAFSNKKLLKQFDTSAHGWLSWITGSGRFDDKKFKEDLLSLRKFYRDAGYLDCEIDQAKVILETVSEDEINVTVYTVERQRYRLGDFSIDNATIYTEDELLGVVSLATGDAFSPQAVDDAATAIREYYTSNGYLDSTVRAERVPNMDTRQIDLLFRVRESEKYYVESIKVEGNTKSKARVIIRELALSPGDVFDRRRLEVSEQRLKNTSYFGDVRLSPEPTNVPGRKDLSVTVSEGRTGNFTFGAGFGSVESAVLYLEVSQGNFDLFNWRSGFQGDGQKFRFRASLGAQSNQILIAFEEPWLFEQRLAFGVELYRTESDYNSADYNELRTGFQVYLRRRLFELVEARLSYRLEIVDIFGVDRFPSDQGSNPDGSITGDGVADVFQSAEGKDLVSKIGLTFLRDTRETLVFTRRGNRTSLEFEYAGLGGDVNYYKLEGRTAHFIPTFDAFDQSLSIIARAGSITPFGQSDIVPFYDRFFLGGPETLRGFDYRDVGPRDPDDDDEAVGGNTYSLVSFEYGFRIAQSLGLVVFYDWGFVNDNNFDFSMSNYADNWGVGARVMLMGSPLKLDLGIPITDPSGQADGTQFNFSFGTRF